MFEIFNDSGSEDEFEGFDPEDVEENVIQPQFYGLSIENWIEGDRKPMALLFTATPGLTAIAMLPDEPQPIVYIQSVFSSNGLGEDY